MSSLAAPSLLRLSYKGKTISIYQEDIPFLIGRGKENCSLIVDTEFASRSHCKITYHDKVFFLEDCSRNGTHVQLGKAPQTIIIGNSIHLVGRGMFKLGEAIDQQDTQIIQFTLDF
jgi:predicted component of type VI protein secretion system